MAAEEQGEKKRKISPTATAYLVLYNVVLCAGWTSIGIVMVKHYLETKTYHGMYEAFEMPLKVFQTAAVLEIVHAIIGIVPSSVVLTAFQVFSRVFLLWGIIYSVPEVQDNIGVTMSVAAWTPTEMIRYAFYTFGLMNRLPYLITWCRYTFFIVLYPLGVMGEMSTFYASLPYIKESDIYTITLPNDYNISFNYSYFVIFIMVMYIPVFPRLYSHMIRQRKKIIGGQVVSKRD
ncbi:very-long-chain (3R)-3-hydroxyacyl-CoA dehydratase 2-like [Saccoglossus kowalevskii]|uniref:Very-long-chain (3R)-3-hydroxyacyl-CoA dehydratase n=1 Tax=Saccoglossus kowalevskii TaxID=10224 RepID=A0ABM0GNE6_SACKO|nr:PREDICTED: very-long-chain (3R)-3-hydroxyacyl-[acyl-carrier protein] dehydratase 2-like [Saccoglossus kowalevskii]